MEEKWYLRRSRARWETNANVLFCYGWWMRLTHIHRSQKLITQSVAPRQSGICQFNRMKMVYAVNYCYSWKLASLILCARSMPRGFTQMRFDDEAFSMQLFASSNLICAAVVFFFLSVCFFNKPKRSAIPEKRRETNRIERLLDVIVQFVHGIFRKFILFENIWINILLWFET